jgi:hypothetical protein
LQEQKVIAENAEDAEEARGKSREMRDEGEKHGFRNADCGITTGRDMI